MNFRDILYMSILFVLVPMWIGYFWVVSLRLRGSVNRLLHAWVLGFVTMLAIAQMLLVPLVALHQSLTTALMCWEMALTIPALASFLCLLTRSAGQEGAFRERGIRQGNRSDGLRGAAPDSGGSRVWIVIFGVLAGILILLQAYIPARYEHRDDDDSRFVSEEVSAVVHDTMYWDDPIGSDQLYWNTGEVKKDLTSPWAMYVAMCSRISGIPPAVLSHTYLPFFLILLCYGLYLLIGRVLCSENWEKIFLFLIFLSVLHLWGYTSTHTLASMLLLRIWQGKAVCASFLLPLLFYLMYQVMNRRCRKGWYALLFVAATGACLLSGIGIVTGPVVLFLYGIVDFMYHRRWKKTLIIWTAALPGAVCLAYYLFG